MTQLKPTYPFKFAPRQGTIHELGQSYVNELEEIFAHLNNLRSNAAGDEEPEAFQMKIDSNGKIYIRNADNSEWIFVGEVKKNFGLDEAGFVKKEDLGLDETGSGEAKNTLSVNITGNAGKIANTEIAVSGNLADNEALVYSANQQKFTNQKVAVVDKTTGLLNLDTTGNAGKIAGKPILTEAIDDGEVLVYRTSKGGFVNEQKSNAIGSGARLLIITARPTKTCI